MLVPGARKPGQTRWQQKCRTCTELYGDYVTNKRQWWWSPSCKTFWTAVVTACQQHAQYVADQSKHHSRSVTVLRRGLRQRRIFLVIRRSFWHDRKKVNAIDVDKSKGGRLKGGLKAESGFKEHRSSLVVTLTNADTTTHQLPPT